MDDKSTMEDIEMIVSTLNTRAKRIKPEYGAVGRLQDVLAVVNGRGVVDAGVVDDHRDLVKAADLEEMNTGSKVVACDDPDCTDVSHEHSHSHSHDHDHDNHDPIIDSSSSLPNHFR